MSRLSDTTFPNPFFLVVKMRCITSMDIKIFTIDVAGQCDPVNKHLGFKLTTFKQSKLKISALLHCHVTKIRFKIIKSIKI